MVKNDGCVAIHADGGAYKPLNWMNAPNVFVDNGDHWTVTNPKAETLTITLHEVLHDSAHELGDDPGLQKDGVEAHLQELLAASPHAIEIGLTLVRREYPTAIGPKDEAHRLPHVVGVRDEEVTSCSSRVSGSLSNSCSRRPHPRCGRRRCRTPSTSTAA